MSTDTIENFLDKSSMNQSCIKAKSGEASIVFPASLVLDIVVVERNKIIRLPFYSKSLLGIASYQSSLVPLIYLEKAIPEFHRSQRFVNHVMAVRLGQAAGELNGVAIAVDRLMGDAQSEQISSQIEFQLSDISPQLWTPIIEQMSLS